MLLHRIAKFTAGFGLLVLALVCLYAMVGLLISGSAVNTFADTGLLVLFGNLALALTVAGLYLLDNPADRRGLGIRKLTLAGWGLLALAANVMAGVAMGIGQIPEFAPILGAGRITVLAGALIGLVVFLIGWFMLSRLGVRIWRKYDS